MFLCNADVLREIPRMSLSNYQQQLQQMVPCSRHGQTVKMAGELRLAFPNILLGLRLIKMDIEELGWSKLKEIIETADETTDAIVDTDRLKRRNNKLTRDIWQELVSEMGWDEESKKFIFMIGGNEGRLTKGMKPEDLIEVKIEDLNDMTPILFDTDWFEIFDKMTEKEDRKRPSHNITWRESDQKKPDLDSSADNLVLNEPEKENNQTGGPSQDSQLQINQLEALRLEAEERILEMQNYYEKRIQTLQENQEKMAEDYDQAGLMDKKHIGELKQQIQLQMQDKVIKKQEMDQLQLRLENDQAEKEDLNKQMAKLRESVQTLTQERQVKLEQNLSEWNMDDSDHDEINPTVRSTPKGSQKRISTVTQVPATLAKLGMSVYNPLKTDKIEYLAKFLAMTKDFTQTNDFKFKKQLLFQAFADDKSFRIQELTDNDQKDMDSLIHAIIKQDLGDSVDLMKHFEMTQLKHGECHRSYYYRVVNLYQIANGLSDEADGEGKTWKDRHSHALKIYFKIEDSLPSGPKAKFIELMIESRVQNAMTLAIINGHLDTIMRIYKDELKKTLGSQKHVLPEVDAIQSKHKKQYQKPMSNERKCWICNKPGHQKKDCPDRYNRRETKTSGSRDKPMQCYKCTGLGHFAKQCPSRYQVNSREHSKWSDKK